MSKLSKNEQGFSAVELVMIIVIIGLIGAVGYLVYKNHHQPVKVVTVTKTVATPAKVTTTVFKIPELGIQFNVPSSLSDLTYSVNTTPPVSNGSNSTEKSVTISTASLATLAPSCAASASYGGFDYVVVGTGNWAGNQPDATLVKQFPNEYVVIAHNQMGCSSIGNAPSESASDYTAFNNAIKSVTLTQ